MRTSGLPPLTGRTGRSGETQVREMDSPRIGTVAIRGNFRGEAIMVFEQTGCLLMRRIRTILTLAISLTLETENPCVHCRLRFRIASH